MNGGQSEKIIIDKGGMWINSMYLT